MSIAQSVWNTLIPSFIRRLVGGREDQPAQPVIAETKESTMADTAKRGRGRPKKAGGAKKATKKAGKARGRPKGAKAAKKSPAKKKPAARKAPAKKKTGKGGKKKK